MIIRNSWRMGQHVSDCFSSAPGLAAFFWDSRFTCQGTCFSHHNLSEDVPVAPGERNNCDHWGAAQDEQNRVKAPEGAEQSPSADRLVPESQQISQRWGPQMLLDPTKIPMWTGFWTTPGLTSCGLFKVIPTERKAWSSWLSHCMKPWNRIMLTWHRSFSSFGADPTLRDTWGRTAYDYAKGKATHDQILKARRIRQPLEHRKPGEWDWNWLDQKCGCNLLDDWWAILNGRLMNDNQSNHWDDWRVLLISAGNSANHVSFANMCFLQVWGFCVKFALYNYV